VKEQILSVGIDIGTTTTQLVFSRLTIDNTASLISVPRIEIVAKEVIYRGPIHFTPLREQDEIDEQQVRRLIEQDYRSAGIAPEQVQTGAIIITGEAARKKNAEAVLNALSCFAGDFVVATAGPTLEGIIAAKGANVGQESKKRGVTIANLDIGGGTTNIAVFRNGEVIDTACLDIGGRLIRFNKTQGTIEYISDKVRHLARSLRCRIEPKHKYDPGTIVQIARRMAEILEEVLGLKPASKDLPFMLTDHDLKRDYKLDYISFSGGVADYINGGAEPDDYKYDDLGVILGRAIAQSNIPRRFQVLKSEETIRATVVGAGTHTTDISGSTISVSPSALPLKNLPVLKLSNDDEKRPISLWGEIIRNKVEWLRANEEKQNMALAFRGPGSLSFSDIEMLAEQIIAGMAGVLCRECPLVVVMERDLAKVVGQTLKRKLTGSKDIICIDSIRVESGDYIDIGRQLADGNVVPVIVKTLAFNY
jgi:ethanolamine utilization protein EutA